MMFVAIILAVLAAMATSSAATAASQQMSMVHAQRHAQFEQLNFGFALSVLYVSSTAYFISSKSAYRPKLEL
jgi:hypothetical protein